MVDRIDDALAPTGSLFVHLDYRAVHYVKVALDRLLRLGWIGPETWIALETAFNEDIAIKGLSVETERRVGKGKLHLLRVDASPADDPAA